MRRRVDINTIEEQAALAYLTDSSEKNRVRTPVDRGQIEIACAVVNRPLTRDDRAAWRNDRVLPDGIGVDPQQIECVVISPNGVRSTLIPEQRESGIYVAMVNVDRVGAWFYGFAGRGDRVFSEESAFDVRASA